jgi:hypothetical protein
MDNSDLNNDEGASRDFMDMRLRVKTEFNISDSLSLTTQFDALDNKHWGDSDLPDDVSDDNIDFDQAYLAAKFNLFDLYVGRMDSDNYGLAFNNSRADVDRIVVSKTLDPITLQLVYEKRSENDASTDDPQTADEDYDVYRLNLEVRQDNFQGCLLTSYYNNKTMSDVSNTDNIPAAGTNPNYAEKFWLFTPYFKANLGPVYLEGEAGWMTGKYRDYTDPDFADDQDLDAMSYYLAANFNAGPAKVGLGYAFVEGDSDANDKDYSAFGFCQDWEPLLILTGFYGDDNLGGLSNLNASGANADLERAGYKIMFATASFSLLENMTLNAIIANAKADEASAIAASADDDMGWEYDLGCKIKLMDNLSYEAKLGYLDAGDLWKGGTDRKVDNTFTFFHKLELTF